MMEPVYNNDCWTRVSLHRRRWDCCRDDQRLPPVSPFRAQVTRGLWGQRHDDDSTVNPYQPTYRHDRGWTARNAALIIRVKQRHFADLRDVMADMAAETTSSAAILDHLISLQQ